MVTNEEYARSWLYVYHVELNSENHPHHSSKTGYASNHLDERHSAVFHLANIPRFGGLCEKFQQERLAAQRMGCLTSPLDETFTLRPTRTRQARGKLVAA